ncbi:MAG: hypothetical protein Q8R17_00540 [bacterium]|nr:hypothetical protein [bacterium]
MSETYATKCFRAIFPTFTAKIFASMHCDGRNFELMSRDSKLEGATIQVHGGEFASISNHTAVLPCKMFNKIPSFSIEKDGVRGQLEEFEPEGDAGRLFATSAR